MTAVKNATTEWWNQATNTLRSVAPAVTRGDDLERVLECTQQGEDRGYFTPQEDEMLRQHFATYLVAREALFELIRQLQSRAQSQDHSEQQLPAFFCSYTAACILVNAGRFVVNLAANSPVLKSKLDEAESRFGLKAKEFTALYASLTAPKHAIRLQEASEFAQDHWEGLKAYAHVHGAEDLWTLLEHTQQSLPESLLEHLKDRLEYRLHSLKRRQSSGVHKAIFGVFEYSGRLFAELVNPLRDKDVTSDVIDDVMTWLKPGDVLITRHKQAVTNLFLPGFWPHAALYIGHDHERDLLGVPSEGLKDKWSGPINILEAQKDGVRLRDIRDTLKVDYFTVIRPKLAPEDITLMLSRAVTHEGKLYDFNFDFSRADRMVCTEVVYRSYQGIGGMEFTLTQRAGRYTLSAEDLLHKALSQEDFEVVATFGFKEGQGKVVTGEKAVRLVRASMD